MLPNGAPPYTPTYQDTQWRTAELEEMRRAMAQRVARDEEIPPSALTMAAPAPRAPPPRTEVSPTAANNEPRQAQLDHLR